MKPDSELNPFIFKRQVEYVYQYLPSNLIANFVNSAILVYIQRQVISHSVMILWLSSIMLISLLRLASAFLFKKKNDLFLPKQWGMIYIVNLFLAGIAWGLAGVYLFPVTDMGHQIIVAFVVGGMIAGASATTSPVKGAFLYYCIPALSPLIYQYLIMPGHMGVSMSMMLMVYAFVTITISRTVYRVTLDAIVFQLTNEKEAEARRAAETDLDKEQEFLKAVLFNIEDGIVACDKQGVLTIFNRAARQLHGLKEQQLKADQWASYYDLYLPDGKTLMEKEEIPLYQAFRGEHVQKQEMIIIPKDGKNKTVVASGQPLSGKNGKKIGAVVSMHDITEQKMTQEALHRAFDDLELKVQERTEELILVNRNLRSEIEERKKAEHEKEKLILELQEAIERIKMLSGIVPICMYCKEIRDDKGYWNKLEKFISEHSEAQFSHSICPKCMAERYPDDVDDEE